MNSTQQKSSTNKSGIVVFGILLVIIGLCLLIMRSCNFSDEIKHLIFSWEMFLMIVGFIVITKRHYLWGSFLMFVGGFLIIPRASFLFPEWLSAPNFVTMYWPLLIIMTGIFLIISFFLKKKRKMVSKPVEHFQEYSGSQMSKIDQKTVFDSNFYNNSTQFCGGTVDVLFGESTIDLRDSTLELEVNELKINVLFGNCRLMVPKDWNIEIKQRNVFGHFEDKRYDKKKTFQGSENRLILNISCVFGGGSIF